MVHGLQKQYSYIYISKRIYNSIIIILYKYILTIETFMYLLEQKNPESLQIHSSLRKLLISGVPMKSVT